MRKVIGIDIAIPLALRTPHDDRAGDRAHAGALDTIERFAADLAISGHHGVPRRR